MASGTLKLTVACKLGMELQTLATTQPSNSAATARNSRHGLEFVLLGRAKDVAWNEHAAALYPPKMKWEARRYLVKQVRAAIQAHSTAA